jgi:hypothetical protein
VISLRPRPRVGHPRARSAGGDVAVVATGSLGFLGAAEDDRRRWMHGFRALLDGIDTRLQVVIDFGGGPPAPAGSDLPRPASARRALDLAFASGLRTSEEAQRREVSFVVPTPEVERLERALTDLGVSDVRRATPPPAAVSGAGERARSVRDRWGWHRTWHLDRYPGGELEPGWLLRLAPPRLRVTLSWHAERLPTAWVVGYLRRQLVHMRASQIEEAEAASDPHLAGALPAARELQRQLVASRENAFHVSLYLTVTADREEGLADASEQIAAAGRSALCVLVPCDFRQLDGRLATLPLGADPLGRGRLLHTSALATLFPWFDADLQQPGGLVVGRSRATGQPVIVDPFDDLRFTNANIGVFGHSGAGKTYLLSTLAMGALGLGVQVFVIDPEHEYGRLATQLGGVDVPLALGSGHALNVLDLRGRVSDEPSLGAAVADAVDLCEPICGGLDERERAVLEAAARAAFAANPTPVLGHVAARLDPGSRVAAILGRWVRGSLGQIFNRPTNVDLDAPVVVFGMRELRPEMIAPVHYLLAEGLWARIKRRDRRRLLVIDELGLLFEDSTIRRFVVTLARRIRKYDGSLVFATQNPGDLLSSEAGAVVATNPAIHFFGALRPGEAAKLQRVFQLSDVQRTRLESARRGEFLLCAGADRLPLRVEAPPWQRRLMGGA